MPLRLFGTQPQLGLPPAGVPCSAIHRVGQTCRHRAVFLVPETDDCSQYHYTENAEIHNDADVLFTLRLIVLFVSSDTRRSVYVQANMNQGKRPQTSCF